MQVTFQPRQILSRIAAVFVVALPPAAQAQFVYGPRTTRPYPPGIHGVRDPFGPRVRGIPGMPSAYDPFGRPGFPMGRQPWMPPSAQDIINDALAGRSVLPGYSGPPMFDPLASFLGQNHSRRNPNTSVNPLFQPNNMPPPSIQAPIIDPKAFEKLHPVRMKDFEAKPPAMAGGGGPPSWLNWRYAVGVFIMAIVVGLLRALIRSEATDR
jgi:hypothetical protein